MGNLYKRSMTCCASVVLAAIFAMLTAVPVWAANIWMGSIPETEPGGILYIGGRYEGARELTVKVYKPGETEVFAEKALTTGPDNSFSFQCQTAPDVEGEYKIEVITPTEIKEVMVLVQKPKPKPTVVDGINVLLDGEYLSFDQPPELINGRTMVPLRVIFEALGADIVWDGDTSTVTATRGEDTIVLTIGQTEAYVNGAAVTLDQPAVLVGGRTLVPVRFISESLGAAVEWDESNETVIITTEQAS